MLYTIPSSSMFVEIFKVRYRGENYIKAWVKYYTKPGKTLLCEERNVKIPLSCFTFWEKVDA